MATVKGVSPADAAKAMMWGIAARFPKSPHEGKQRLYLTANRGDMLNLPVPDMAGVLPGQSVKFDDRTASRVLSVILPLDIDNLLTGDVQRLNDVHAIIHHLDFLSFDADCASLDIERDLRMVCYRVYFRYRDPFLGTLNIAKVVEEDTFSDSHAREILMDSLVHGVCEERQNKLAELMAAIDYAKENYGVPSN